MRGGGLEHSIEMDVALSMSPCAAVMSQLRRHVGVKSLGHLRSPLTSPTDWGDREIAGSQNQLREKRHGVEHD